MGHTVTETYSCNLCGISAEGSNRYGWVSLLPQHICTELLGHNRIDLLGEIILCNICWPKVLGPLEVEQNFVR